MLSDSKVAEFQKLDSWKKKTLFWEDNLNMNYVEFLLKFNELYELHPYKIEVEKQDYASFNQWILKNYKSLGESPSLLLELKELKKKVNLEIKNNASAADYLIQEIDRIKLSNKNALGDFNVSYNSNVRVFNQYLQYAISPDYTILNPGLMVIYAENGKTLAMYCQYIESLLKKYKDRQFEQYQELTHSQLALFLQFTDVLPALQMDVSDKARIFAAVLNRNQKHLYDAFRNVNSKKIKTRENLEAVKNTLVQNDLRQYTSAVDELLEKID